MHVSVQQKCCCDLIAAAFSFFIVRFLRRIIVFPESEKTLSDVVKCNEQTHACKHGDVFLNGLARSAEYMTHQRFGDSVGDAVAHSNIGNKPQYHAEAALFISEGIVFIQKIAQYTAEEIVRGR